MKTPQLLLVVLIGFGAFSFPVHAATVYQQFLDNTGIYTQDGSNNIHVLGTFTVPTTQYFSEMGMQYTASQTYHSGSPANLINIYIGTTTVDINQTIAAIPFNSGNVPNDGQYHYVFDTNTNHYPSIPLEPNTTYYIYTTNNIDRIKFVTDVTRAFVFGYVTTDSQDSFPIQPGIPGYSIPGIATSSLKIYCNASFGTSTFADTVTAAISDAFCNIGVFLFMPDNSAINQFVLLGSTTQQKIPFSYFNDVYGTFLSLQASTTENLPTLTIDLSSVDLGSSTPLGQLIDPQITILSTSTISRFFSDDNRHAWLNFLRAALWLMVALHIYHLIQSGKFLRKT